MGLLGGAALVIGIGAIPTMASAQDFVDLGDAQSIVSNLVPALVGVEGERSEVSIESNGVNARSSVASAPSVEATPNSPDVEPVAFTIDYALSGAVETSGEFQVIKTSDEQSRAYVQPTSNGVRILTAIGSSEAPEEYSYTFDVPEGTQLKQSHEGRMYSIVGPDGAQIGVLSAPWAVDATGQSVDTSFSWSGSTLIQHVDLSSSTITYPVVADPDWSYGLNFSIGATSAGIASMMLHSCFNCYFPVAGAPAAFPVKGQLLPLTVGWGPIQSNFNCYMESVPQDSADLLSWYFTSAPGHVDGPGSAIFFDVLKAPDGSNRLYVAAFVHNDSPNGIPNAIYAAGAAVTWQTFASNLTL
jgi:hypothetical protein